MAWAFAPMDLRFDSKKKIKEAETLDSKPVSKVQFTMLSTRGANGGTLMDDSGLEAGNCCSGRFKSSVN